MVSLSFCQRGVGRQRALSDGGRRTDGSFYFVLEPPLLSILWDNWMVKSILYHEEISRSFESINKYFKLLIWH